MVIDDSNAIFCYQNFKAVYSYTCYSPLFNRFIIYSYAIVGVFNCCSIIKKNQSIIIPFWLIVINVLLMSLLFEWYEPIFKNNTKQTADGFDVVMYVLGGILYYLIQKTWFQRYIEKPNN